MSDSYLCSAHRPYGVRRNVRQVKCTTCNLYLKADLKKKDNLAIEKLFMIYNMFARLLCTQRHLKVFLFLPFKKNYKYSIYNIYNSFCV